MIVAVLDPNVLISALLSRKGTPARLLVAWRRGDFELVVSRKLLSELERALAYPKLLERISAEEATEFVDLLGRSAAVAPDPDAPAPVASADPGDDYLIALASARSSRLVSGDAHLLDLSDRIPVHSPKDFLGLIGSG